MRANSPSWAGTSLYPSLLFVYPGASAVPGAITTVVLVDSSAIAVSIAVAVAVGSLLSVLPHLYIDQSLRPSDETQKE